MIDRARTRWGKPRRWAGEAGSLERLEVPGHEPDGFHQDTNSPVLGPVVSRGGQADVFALGRFSVLRVDKKGTYSTTERAILAWQATQRGGGPVPAFCKVVEVGGHVGIAMERLEPEHLLCRLGRSPWIVRRVGRIMGNVHAALHEIPGPRDLPAPNDIVLERLAHYGLCLPKVRSMLMPFNTGPRQLLHGDFNPANLLRHPGSRRWLAVDWGSAMCGDPAADVAMTLVMIRYGSPPGSAPVIVRRLAPMGRSLLAAAYLREYLRHRALNRDAVRAWQLVWASLRSLDA
jgi:hypothetical protein